MERISQESHYRERTMKDLEHHGVEETANWYRVCRKTVWKWGKRWDGTVESLEEKSRRPHECPRKQKQGELKLVRRMRKKHGSDLILAYQNACQYGYRRSYGCFKRTAAKECPPTKAKKKRRNKPYERAQYPGQKSPDGRKVRTNVLYSRWKEILSIYG